MWLFFQNAWEASFKGMSTFMMTYWVKFKFFLHYHVKSCLEAVQYLNYFFPVYDSCRQKSELCVWIHSYSYLSTVPKAAAKLPLYYHLQKIDFSLPLSCARNPRFLLSELRLWSNDNSYHLQNIHYRPDTVQDALHVFSFIWFFKVVSFL